MPKEISKAKFEGNQSRTMTFSQTGVAKSTTQGLKTTYVSGPCTAKRCAYEVICVTARVQAGFLSFASCRTMNPTTQHKSSHPAKQYLVLL